MALLLVAHVLCATTGYTGFIACNAYLLYVTRAGDAAAVASCVTAWRKTARIFGGLFFAGVLFGFALAVAFRVPLNEPWLLATYALIGAIAALQGTLMVPWQIRSDRSLAAGTIPSVAPVRVVLLALCAGYTATLALMLVRPG